MTTGAIRIITPNEADTATITASPVNVDVAYAACNNFFAGDVNSRGGIRPVTTLTPCFGLYFS